MPDDGPLDAGDLRDWIDGLFGPDGADVPCGGCTACCEASQFVHVAPDEIDAMAHIPRPLLFPAPGYPEGHLLMGYDERGRCPMLRDDGCSIYDHRPRTCRTYDCRVFTVTGIEPTDASQHAIASRARRWRFSVTDARTDDFVRRAREAAAALHEQDPDIPDLRRAIASLDAATPRRPGVRGGAT